MLLKEIREEEKETELVKSNDLQSEVRIGQGSYANK